MSTLSLVNALRFRHKEHRCFAEYWDLLSAIVEGGDRITDEIKLKLLPNPDGRPEEVMQERIKLATYCNKIAPILARFNSELFKNPGVPIGSNDGFWADSFFPNGALLQCDDDGRASFTTFLQEAMMMALTTGKAIAQIDTIASKGAISLAQQKEYGELNPYVVLHPRSALWDWEADRHGFKFAKLHQFRIFRESWNSKPTPEHVFTLYNRNDDKVYTSKYIARKRNNDQRPFTTYSYDQPFIENCAEKEIVIETVIENQPIFNVNGIFEFPIVTLSLPKVLCMGAQLLDAQKSYFTQTAALEYAMYTNNYAIPVVTGVDDESDDPLKGKRVGDGYYLTLKTGQNITNFERSNVTIDNAIKYRAEIKRDIYDIVQQIAMSASDGAAIISRSGESKREDRRSEEILLEKYGQIVKEFILQVLRPASIAHGELVNWSITGYDDFIGFSLAELLQDLDLIKKVNIPSEAFNKEIYKHFVKRAGRVYDLDEQVINLAITEIESKEETIESKEEIQEEKLSEESLSKPDNESDEPDESDESDEIETQEEE